MAVVAAVLAEFGVRDAVLSGGSVSDALRRSWKLARANLGATIIAWLFALIIGIGGGIAIGIGVVILMVPIGILCVVSLQPRPSQSFQLTQQLP